MASAQQNQNMQHHHHLQQVASSCTSSTNVAVEDLFEEFNLDDIEVIESKVFA